TSSPGNYLDRTKESASIDFDSDWYVAILDYAVLTQLEAQDHESRRDRWWVEVTRGFQTGLLNTTNRQKDCDDVQFEEPVHQVESRDFSVQHESHHWGHCSAKIQRLSKSVYSPKLVSFVCSPVPCLGSVPS